MNKNLLVAVYAASALIAIQAIPVTRFVPLSLAVTLAAAIVFARSGRVTRRNMVYASPALVLVALAVPAVAVAGGALIVAASLASLVLFLSSVANNIIKEN